MPGSAPRVALCRGGPRRNEIGSSDRSILRRVAGPGKPPLSIFPHTPTVLAVKVWLMYLPLILLGLRTEVSFEWIERLASQALDQVSCQGARTKRLDWCEDKGTFAKNFRLEFLFGGLQTLADFGRARAQGCDGLSTTSTS